MMSQIKRQPMALPGGKTTKRLTLIDRNRLELEEQVIRRLLTGKNLDDLRDHLKPKGMLRLLPSRTAMVSGGAE